jgi:hypothetical protein
MLRQPFMRLWRSGQYWRREAGSVIVPVSVYHFPYEQYGTMHYYDRRDVVNMTGNDLVDYLRSPQQAAHPAYLEDHDMCTSHDGCCSMLASRPREEMDRGLYRLCEERFPLYGLAMVRCRAGRLERACRSRCWLVPGLSVSPVFECVLTATLLSRNSHRACVVVVPPLVSGCGAESGWLRSHPPWP